MGKKYKILFRLPGRECKIRYLKDIPGTAIKVCDDRWISGSRSLSQLGTCHGYVPAGGMVFGDSYRMPDVSYLISKGIFETETRIFHRFAFSNKLARFVRS